MRRRVSLELSESESQAIVVAWAATMSLYDKRFVMLIAIPNGARTSWTQAKKLKREGMRAGVPDLFLAIKTKEFGGLWIEMKTETGRVSEAQAQWHKDLAACGYKVEVCRSAESAMYEIAEYLGVKL
jgi:hypothetical protein